MTGTAGRAGNDETRWGVPLRYAAELGRLGEICDRFVPSHLDTEGEAFLASQLKRTYRMSGLRLHRVLSTFLSDFDVNGLLGMYPVFLLSTPMAIELLEKAARGSVSERSLLDIGSGSGDVTTRLAPLVRSVDCTETSRFMVRRLRRRGFECFRGAAGEAAPGDPLGRQEPYDIVSLLNVIDRTSRPRSLLRAIARHLRQDGILLLSTPLPFEPVVYHGGATSSPEEPLGIEAEGWEDAVLELWRNELAPLGFELGALTRTPYLSGGDALQPAYVLDAAVLACRKR
jgi:SAM-dependent methyltransferase